MNILSRTHVPKALFVLSTLLWTTAIAGVVGVVQARPTWLDVMFVASVSVVVCAWWSIEIWEYTDDHDE